MTRRCEFYISEVCFVSRCAFLMPSVGSSLAIVTAAASTCYVPDLRSVLITCFKGLFLLIVVSQLFTKSAPLESSGREDRDPPDGRDDGREETWVTVENVAWPSSGKWSIGRTRLPEMSFVMMLVCWMMWRLCCRRQRPKEERSSIHAIRKRVNSSPEGVWW